MSRSAAFALGCLAGAASLIALAWAYVAYDAWSMDHQKQAPS